MARNSGWIPQQHGAYAMMGVPILLGVAERTTRPGAGPFLVPLVATMGLGFLAFSAMQLFVKSPPRRRSRVARPVIIYSTLTAVAGMATLGMGSWQIVGWLGVYVPLMAVLLLLAMAGHEATLLSRCLAAAMAASTLLVCAYPRTPRFLREWPTPYATGVRWLTVVCALYFVGTVFLVKSLIRERGNDRFWHASLAYHGVAVALSALGAAFGHLSPVWIGFFAAALGRAWAQPHAQRRGRRLSPLFIGLLEAGFSVTLVLLALAFEIG